MKPIRRGDIIRVGPIEIKVATRSSMEDHWSVHVIYGLKTLGYNWNTPEATLIQLREETREHDGSE